MELLHALKNVCISVEQQTSSLMAVLKKHHSNCRQTSCIFPVITLLRQAVAALILG
jgi:hypothetical protein